MKRLMRSFLVATLAVIVLPSVVMAATVSHTYDAKLEYQQGTIVALKGNSVELAAASTANYQSLGIVVPTGSTLVEIQTGNATVEVVTSGTVPTIVSDINGPVKRGDVITISPIPGIGMKRITSGQAVGIAQADLESSQDLSNQTINLNGGGSKSIKVGLVTLALTSGNDGNALGNIPSWVRGLANGVAGHQVSDARVIAALVVFVAAIVWTVVLIYSGIVGGILATGRNPLSGGWVFLNILALLLYIAIIMGITLSLVYALLRT